jgi:hypothetical protein
MRRPVRKKRGETLARPPGDDQEKVLLLACCYHTAWLGFVAAKSVSVLGRNLIEIHLPLRREPVYQHRLLRPGESRQVSQWIGEMLGLIQSRSQIIISSFPVW